MSNLIVPASWPRTRARFLFREVVERHYDLPLASVTKDGGVEFRDDLDISVWNPAEDDSSYKRVLPGDFVIGLRSFQSGIGFSRIAGLVSPAYTVLRPIQPIEHRYFKHYFKSDVLISQLENVSQGIRQGRTISTESFYNLKLPVPSDHTQRAIADFLDTETVRIDTLIEKKRQLVSLLHARVESHVSARLRSIEVRRGFSPLKSVADVRVSNVDKKTIEGEESVRLCNYTDVYYSREIDSATDFMSASATPEQIRAFELRRGDVLITKDSETADDIGIPAYVPEDMLESFSDTIRPSSVHVAWKANIFSGFSTADGAGITSRSSLRALRDSGFDKATSETFPSHPQHTRNKPP